MSLAVAAVLAGGGYPRAVQVAITGLTVGAPFLVTGALADGTTWTVRGGNGQTVTATTAILADVSTPINVPVTYTAAQTGLTPATSAPITVPYSGRYVLQSLDGRTAIPVTMLADASSRSTFVRTVSFAVPGRTTPVIRWDVSGGESGSFDVMLPRSSSDALRTLLTTGAPAVAFRSDGTVYDWPASFLCVITSAASRMLSQGYTDRIWTLGYTVIADPEPSTVLAASDWDDFDATYAAQTWDQFDAYWSTLTWDDFDATDWSTF